MTNSPHLWIAVASGCALVIMGAVLFGRHMLRQSRFAHERCAPRQAEMSAERSLETAFFPAIDGTALEGWLFRPRTKCRGVVVMAPGLGGTKEGLLEPFAWRFVQCGFAVLAFDYRSFGGSGGMPRHHIDPSRHREDYEAALAFVRGPLASAGTVDASHVALWGSSFSGGTALLAAARDGDVAAVIAQCPYLKTPPALQPKGWTLARYVVAAALDTIGALPPIYIPLYGRPGEYAFALSAENPSVSNFRGGAGSAFWRELPGSLRGGWENKMLARGIATLDDNVPMDAVSAVRCPVLFIAAREDDMVPLAFVEEGRSLARHPGSDIAIFDCAHFDLYLARQPQSAERQAAFLEVHLGGRRQPS